MTDTTTRSDDVTETLAGIRERYEAATPGNWGVGNGEEIALSVEQHTPGSFAHRGAIASVTGEFDREDEEAWIKDENGSPLVLAAPEDDAEFIAHAHQDLPRLLAAVEGVLALADRAEHGATRWQDPLPVPEWVGEARALIVKAMMTDHNVED